MKFLDSLTQFLDATLGTPPSHSMWDGLSSGGIGITGVTPEDRGPLVDHGNPSTVPDLAEQFAIAQKRTQGFTVVDVSPFHVDRANFAPQMPPTMIFDKVGYDGDAENNTLSTANLSAWRTIPLSNSGNFLRIEFLPAKVNSLSAQVLPDSGATKLGVFNEDQTYSQFVAATSQNVNGNPEHTFANISARNLTSSPVVLVQFDNPQGPILVARDGMQFNCPFQTVYVTFKCDAPRFSIITGFNTGIIEAAEHRTLAANPAFGPGYGLWDNPSRHCKPFSFGAIDQAISDSLKTLTFNASGNQQVELILFINGATATSTPSTSKIVGTAWGWVTDFGIGIMSETVNNSDAMQIEGRIRIKSGSIIRAAGLTAYRNIAVISGIGPKNGGGVNVNRSYNTPRRFALLPGDALVLTLNVTMGSSATVDYTFSIEGYVYGDTQETDTSSRTQVTVGGAGGGTWITNGFNGWVLEALESNPFPLDHRWNPQTGL